MNFIGIQSSFYQNSIQPVLLCLDSHIQFKTMVGEFLAKINEVVVVNFSVYCDISEQPRIKQTLTVKELNQDEDHQLEKTVEEWLLFSKTKATQTDLLLPNLINDLLPPQYYFHRQDVFKDSVEVCSCLIGEIRGGVWGGRVKMFICQLDPSDNLHNIQAISLVHINALKDKPYMCIWYLLAKAHNLVAPINKHQPNRLAGAASKLLDHFKKNVCPEYNLKKIILHPSSSSKDFYINSGFVEKQKSNGKKMVFYINPPKKTC